MSDTPEREDALPIWNPNPAANWSLLFSPAFGAFIHMLNWRTLGEDAKATAARGWFIVSLVLLAFYVALGLAAPNSDVADGASRAIGLTYLITWYFVAARGQAKYVKEKFGTAYARRGWAKPLLVGVLALAGYFALIVVLVLVFGIAAQA